MFPFKWIIFGCITENRFNASVIILDLSLSLDLFALLKEIRHRKVKQHKTHSANITFVGMFNEEWKKEKH